MGRVHCPGKWQGGRGNLKIKRDEPTFQAIMGTGMNPE